MALHELCTNATKYGALSTNKGAVKLEWSEAGLNGSRQLSLRWTELGGPEVRMPERRGFGTRLIERGLSRDLGGEARMEFVPTGVICTISVSLPNDKCASESLPAMTVQP